MRNMKVGCTAVLRTGTALFGAALLFGTSGIRAQIPNAPPQIKADKSEHVTKYMEDPFVTKYRKKFFSVFAGKTGEFEQGMSELDAMLAKNPNDARALVWHGNGLMVRAGLKKIQGQSDAGRQLLIDSKKELDRAVSLDPDNVNILAMRAVTLHIAGQYWKASDMPAGSWQAIIADLEKTRRIIPPQAMKKLSIHARGEILTELADAYQKAGMANKSRSIWLETLKSVPNSRYAAQAKTALETLTSGKS